jgi:DNA ligase-1
MSEPFTRFAETAERVRATTSKLEKMKWLAELFATLSEEDLSTAARLFAGAPFPRSDERVLGLGWSTIVDVVLSLTGASPDELGESYQRYADLGDVTEALFAAAGRAAAAPPLTLAEVAAAFADCATTRGSARKRALLETLLRRAGALEAKYLVKVMTGEMRIGLREGLLEDAIARATGQSLQEVAWANMLTGDIGETAVRARRRTLAEAQLHLFHPLGFMLATPVLELAEVAKRFPPPYLVEDKYDGIRVQVHKEGPRVELYSRTLDRVTHRFPELQSPLQALPPSFVMDAEVVGLRAGRAIPFVSFQKRLGRKTIGDVLLTELPAALFAFDLLACEGEPLLDLPLSERRARLAALPLQPPLALARSEIVDAPADALPARLDALFAQARDRGNEGLMVKDLRSRYRPGRRGMEWLKVKRALRTLDVVVTGVEWGHGKRRAVLSDYTFAVRDGDRLLDVGKAYSGLTDEEIAEMTRFFLAHTIRDYGRFRSVEPTVVIEVAFDNVQASNRHPSGYALRFPRIVRLRPDKRPAEVDTLDTVRELAGVLEAEPPSTRSAER